MKIRSAKSFRLWYKNLIPARKHAAQYWDENFMGVQHKDLSGFLAMYHGDKEDIYGFLRKEVEMAEDGQAIYEFVQNAADSDSTKFYMFYDENHLIVINNGNVFSKEGVKSILNIGQSFGKEDPDKIGRYGIGFKLVHRLVGKSSGLDELFNIDEQGYRGPILFSWSEKLQFNNFLNTNENDFDYVDFNNNDAPWLLKILITNFPAQPKETIKDTNFNVIEPFQVEELNSFQTFLKSCRDKIDSDSLDSGTIFFLKLGDKKFDYLERQKQEYLNGLSTSMHFLKSLDTLVINEDVIRKDKEANNILNFTVENGSDDFNKIGLTEIRDKESDAQFKICFADNPNSANEIKKHPNIYKYFPAVKEVNNLSFVIHSNLFELSSNRQNLTETPINKNLLGLLSKRVIEKMEVSKTENRSTFKNLFISILMSEESSSSSSGNGWQSEYFYNVLLEYIQKTIPTKSDAFSNNARSVKINKLKLNLDLDDLGLSHIQWFEWDSEEDKLLIGEAKNKEKLGIEEWDIRHIIENANLEKINDWIASCEKETYERFLKELEGSGLRNATEEKIRKIKLFKFSNDKFFSLDEVIKKDNFGRPVFKFTNCFFSNHKTKGIKNVLIKLGLVVSELFVEDYPKMFSSIAFPDDRKHYDLIAEWCIENGNKLSGEEKKNIFLNFINNNTKFDNVANDTLKDLKLFCNSNSQIKPLNRLIHFELNTASWLNPYKIKSDEFFTELKTYLVSEQEDIFNVIYLPNQEIIISGLTEANEIKSLIKLYQSNQNQFFKKFIIKKTEHSFSIVEKTINTFQVQSADKEARNFIDKYCSDKLFVLPYDFLEFKEEDGIVKNNELYINIIDCVEIDELQEELITIISKHYVSYQAKLKFLNTLPEIKFVAGSQYNNDSVEYKILDLACQVLKESQQISKLREKIIVESNGKNFKPSKILPTEDKIKIATKEFSLSKILPSTHQNNNLISDLILQFEGIPREKLNALFGVSEEPESCVIFQMFSEQVETLENPEQFFFLLYYHQDNPKVDLSKLGFDIECAVYPSEFALKTEKLPLYLQEWIEQGKIKISSLESVGIYTENSTLVSLRKYLLLKSEFDRNTIAQDEKLLDGKMLLNTFEWLKDKEIELRDVKDFAVFKEMVRVINSKRATGQELGIQEPYNFALLEEKSTFWNSIGEFSIYLHKGVLPKLVKLNEVKDYVFYRYPDGDYAVNGKNIYINENEDKTKILQKVASDDDNDFTSENSKDIELSEVKAELEKYKKQEQPKEENTNSSFLEDVNNFISELEGTEWEEYQSDLKSLMQGFTDQPKEKQKLFNLIAKIKLTKEKNAKFEDFDEAYNVVKIGNEKFFVHSARGAFAYIHPSEILKMEDEDYKMALDFGKNFKIYETAKEILELNSIHLLAYKNDSETEALFDFCEANRDANKHLLIIDKNNSGEQSRALLKLLNIEDDYQ